MRGVGRGWGGELLPVYGSSRGSTASAYKSAQRGNRKWHSGEWHKNARKSCAVEEATEGQEVLYNMLCGPVELPLRIGQDSGRNESHDDGTYTSLCAFNIH